MKDVNSIKHNIAAINETRQITNAMYLLSTSRAKRAMTHIDYNKEYMKRLRAAMRDVFAGLTGQEHIYTHPNGCKKKAYLLVTSDKGLCGAYNTAVVNYYLKNMTTDEKSYIAVIGAQAYDMLKFRGITPELQWIGPSHEPSIHYARNIAEHFMQMYDNGYIGSVEIVYTRFDSQAVQTVESIPLLPMLRSRYVRDNDTVTETNYEPDIHTVLDTLIPECITGVIYECLSQANACEHIARMTAMQSATDNADELIAKLNLEYNCARQLSITNEITEIAAATSVSEEN